MSEASDPANFRLTPEECCDLRYKIENDDARVVNPYRPAQTTIEILKHVNRDNIAAVLEETCTLILLAAMAELLFDELWCDGFRDWEHDTEVLSRYMDEWCERFKKDGCDSKEQEAAAMLNRLLFEHPTVNTEE